MFSVSIYNHEFEAFCVYRHAKFWSINIRGNIEKINNILDYEIPHTPGILYASVEKNEVFATEKKIRSVDFEEKLLCKPIFGVMV